MANNCIFTENNVFNEAYGTLRDIALCPSPPHTKKPKPSITDKDIYIAIALRYHGNVILSRRLYAGGFYVPPCS